MHNPLTLKQIKHRPARWLRRTRWMARQMLVALGLGGARPLVWLRDNPFLFKAGLSDLRRFRLGWRLAWTVGTLILLGAASLVRTYPQAIRMGAVGAFGVSLPFALLCVLVFVHATLIASARQAASISVTDELRRGYGCRICS